MRYYKGKPIELLAPAGNLDILKQLIHSNADAFYIGGKILNMRMHRSDFNFSNEALREAVILAHENNKKIYITVNNLMDEKDIEDAKNFLQFLNTIKPDGIIVQDLALLELIHTMSLSYEIHSSVMMNVHNIEMVKLLKSKGFTRLVTSREIPLSTIKNWKNQIEIEFEYFVHGDMCISHGSQCLYSSLTFGKSSNRGLCMKPCRWQFELESQTEKIDPSYPMAVKDMYMYENIPELIENGITSFKLEGRMRDADYMIRLINAYGDAIDRYIALENQKDKSSYDRKKEADYLYKNRKRDFSTAFAFENLGLKNINERYEGTGFFYSHGRVFSEPVNEHPLNAKKIAFTRGFFEDKPVDITTDFSHHHHDEEVQGKPFHLRPKLSVKIKSLQQYLLCVQLKVDEIILDMNFINCEVLNSILEHHKKCFYDKKDISDYLKKTIPLIYGMPQMTFDLQLSEIIKHFDENQNMIKYIDGFMITNIGQIDVLKAFNLPLYSDFSANTFNHLAIDALHQLGVQRSCLSIELNKQQMKALLENNSKPVELIVGGKPSIMLLEHDLYENFTTKNHQLPIYAVNDIGVKLSVFKDLYDRNHVLSESALFLLPLLDIFMTEHISHLRLEIQHFDDAHFQEFIIKYKGALQAGVAIKEKDYSGYTLGALNF